MKRNDCNCDFEICTKTVLLDTARNTLFRNKTWTVAINLTGTNLVHDTRHDHLV